MTQKQVFLRGKEKAIESLDKAKNEGKADEKILPILNILNRSEEYYTSSSCSGRIVLLEIPEIGDKKNAKFLGKWHRCIDYDEVIDALQKAKKGQIWLLAQSSIIHIVSANLNAADKLIKIANASGFKNSGIKSINSKIICEICSTERLDAPIGNNQFLYCNEEYLQLLVNIANEIIEKSTKKLLRFELKLKKCLSTHKTTK
jgi:tRNA wybutosine-synthesizing protein 3